MGFLKYLLSKEYRKNYSTIFVELLNFEEQFLMSLYNNLSLEFEQTFEEEKAS